MMRFLYIFIILSFISCSNFNLQKPLPEPTRQSIFGGPLMFSTESGSFSTGKNKLSGLSNLKNECLERHPDGSVLNSVYLSRSMRFQILKRRSARRTLWRIDCGLQTIRGRCGHLFRSSGSPNRSAWSRPHRSGMSRAS